MRILLAALLPLLAFAPTVRAEGKPLTLVVMDPLAADLSCPCVKGYAQRDYPKLAAYLSKQLGRPVKIHFAESVSGALTKKTEGKADIIIGKDSVVRSGAAENKLAIECIAALTGKDGKTTQTGLWVVAAKDKAVLASDLQGYRLIFGQPEAAEKWDAALALLKDLGVKIPAKKEECGSCSTAAKKVVDAAAAGEKVAAVISSYAQPLLEGCGTVKKGELRVIGETDPVPFVTAFVNTKLPSSDRAAIQKALLAIASDVELCKKMETKKGFVSVPAAKKK